MRSILSVLVSAIGIASCASADPPPAPDRLPQLVISPESIVARAEVLGIDDVQRTAMRAELAAGDAALAPLEIQLRESRLRLARALDREVIDEGEAIAATEALVTIEGEIKLARMRLLIRLRNRLTPSQRARL